MTGTHGAARHMGNAFVVDSARPESAITDATLNRSTLDARVDAAAYPAASSDIAALLVFDHQGRAINLLTRLGWETRIAAAEGRLDFSKGDLRAVLAGNRRLPAVRRRGDARRRRCAACRPSRRSFARDRPERSRRPIAARARSADAAVQVPLQLHDLLAGVRCASGGSALGGLRAHACAAHRSRHDRDPRRDEDRGGADGVAVGDDRGRAGQRRPVPGRAVGRGAARPVVPVWHDDRQPRRLLRARPGRAARLVHVVEPGVAGGGRGRVPRRLHDLLELQSGNADAVRGRRSPAPPC